VRQRDRDCSVQPHDRPWRGNGEQVVEVDDASPFGRLRSGRAGVLRCDRRLERVRARHPQVTDELETLVDLPPVPQPAILIFQEHELAIRARARVASRVLEKHECEQPGHLGLVGHQGAEDAREPDRLGAQLPPHERLGGRRRVALVEDQVERGEHRGESVGQLVVGRHDIGDAGAGDLALRPDEPLLHGRLGGQKCMGDLGRPQAAEGA
jgi:hypothetical protein